MTQPTQLHAQTPEDPTQRHRDLQPSADPSPERALLDLHVSAGNQAVADMIGAARTGSASAGSGDDSGDEGGARGGGLVHRLAEGGVDSVAGPMDSGVATRIKSSRANGQPLDDGVRQEMERGFGTSLADVRIHTGPESDDLNRDLRAQAFTTGSDIFLRQDAPSTDSEAGRHLLAHELAHVVQQRTEPTSGPMVVGRSDDPAEQLADRAADDIVRFGETRRPPEKPADAAAVPRVGSEVRRSSPPSPSVAARMTAVESTFNSVAANAQKRSTALNTASDSSLTSLKAAKDHLKESNDVYKAGYDTFKGVIETAEKQAASDAALEDAIEGVLVAMALTALTVATCGTGAVAASAALSGFRAIAAKTLVEVGKSAVGEGAEMVTGGAVNVAQDEDANPNATVAGAGDSPGQRFEQAFGHLSRMIDVIEAAKLGSFASSQTTLALKAKDLQVQAVKLGAGQDVDVTPEHLESEAKRLKDLDTDNASVDEHREALTSSVESMKAEIENVQKPTDATAVERQLWVNWMANLGDNNELLDNDAIQEYLGPEGSMKLMDWGSYMLDEDQVREMSEAQREILKAEGVELPADMPPEKVSSEFFRRKAMKAVEAKMIGKVGNAEPGFYGSDPMMARRAAIDGQVWDIEPVCTGGLSVQLRITGVVVPTYLRNAVKNDWNDLDFLLQAEVLAPAPEPEPAVAPEDAVPAETTSAPPE